MLDPLLILPFLACLWISLTMDARTDQEIWIKGFFTLVSLCFIVYLLDIIST